MLIGLVKECCECGRREADGVSLRPILLEPTGQPAYVCGDCYSVYKSDWGACSFCGSVLGRSYIFTLHALELERLARENQVPISLSYDDLSPYFFLCPSCYRRMAGHL